MKVMIISCLEPRHLKTCLRSLLMWVPKKDIFIYNNANTQDRKNDIGAICEQNDISMLRPPYVENQKNTKPFIHRITNDFAKMFPDDIILKIDEDNILVSDVSKFDFARGTFFFPTSTINNYTTRFFLRKFWPDLDNKLKDTTWMWHKPEPIEMKIVLFDAIYGSHPKDLIEHLNLQSTRTHITQHNYMHECLMSERGISTHAVAFYGQDHIDNYGDESFNQEVRFFDLVKQGVMKYVIDHSIFCHHINYHSVRELVQQKAELVSVFHKRLFEYYEEKIPKTPRKVPPRSKVVHASHDGANVCVTIGWYSDFRGGKRNAHTLAPQLFESNYLNDTLIPRIQRQIDPRIILIHSSQCEIPPDPVPFGHNIEVVHGYRKAKRNTTAGQPPYAIGGAHDWGATMMTGAQYAYCNDLDFIFYEQDCLVHNFTKVLEIAEGKSIVYGYGKNSSYGDGWAEPSLTFVSNEFLPEFINRLNKGKWHQWTEGFARFKHPEIQFHNTFADVAEYWPFGYGMKRPINFKDEVYFAQRFIEDDFLNFLKHSQV